MDFKQYRDLLLSSIPTAVSASGGNFVTCRCFYCPDGKDPKSKHMYIAIPKNDNEVSWYYCHKCHASGIVTNEVLMKWGVYDNQIGIDITNHNKNYRRNNIRNTKTSRAIYLNNSFTSNNETSLYKLNYINNRIGTNLSYEDLRKLKICLNLKDLLDCNHIQTITRDPRVVDQLDANFLGFISIDNSFINMRRLCDEGKVISSIDSRYINYKIFNFNEDEFDMQRFYTIPTSIDLLSTERIKIHVAEGPFDILSIYQNIRKGEPGIYSSIGGSNYQGTIFYFLKTYKLPYVEIHLYPDNDKYGSNYKMKSISDLFNSLGIPVYIHRNIYPDQKDFGVSPNLIQESIYQL